MAPQPPIVQWVEGSPSGILIQDGSPKVWHSGRVIDVLSLGGDRLLVGSETGGVWVAEPNGSSKPFSHDWDNPDVLCTAQRFGFHPPVFLVGTAGGLFQSGIGFPSPLSSWIELNLPDRVRSVYRIVTLPDIR